MCLCRVSDAESSGVIRGGDRTTFHRLGLRVKIVRNLVGSQRSMNVRSLESSRVGRSLGSACRDQAFWPPRSLREPRGGPMQCVMSQRPVGLGCGYLVCIPVVRIDLRNRRIRICFLTSWAIEPPAEWVVGKVAHTVGAPFGQRRASRLI